MRETRRIRGRLSRSPRAPLKSTKAAGTSRRAQKLKGHSAHKNPTPILGEGSVEFTTLRSPVSLLFSISKTLRGQRSPYPPHPSRARLLRWLRGRAHCVPTGTPVAMATFELGSEGR